MFEKFSADARAAVIDAVTVAQESGTRWVGREHLLVGLASNKEPTLVAAGLTREHLMSALRGVSAETPAEGGTNDADAEALKAIGIDLDAIREAVDREHGEGAWDAAEVPRRPRESGGLLGWLLPAKRPPFTSGAKKTLELALREAIADQSKTLTATHVLRGLLRDPGPVAADMIQTKLPVATLRRRAAEEPPAA